MGITEDATVTSKGQVTIPKAIREQLDIGAGTELEFVLKDDGDLTVRPKKQAMARLREVRDRLSKHDVDLEKVRRDSEDAWSSIADDGDST